MNLFRDINQIRRTIMRGLTKNVGAANVIPVNDEAEPLTIARVLIIRPNNRLGNLLLITPLVQEISRNFPEAKIDLFTRGGLAGIIFKNYPSIDRIIQLPKKPFKHLIDYAAGWFKVRKHRYDLVINVINNSSSGRLSTKLANSGFKIFGDVEDDIKGKFEDHTHVAKYPVYNLRKYLSIAGYNTEAPPVPALDLKLSIAERTQGQRLLKELVHNHKKTICLFTFATGFKMYPKEWWEKFYDRLKHEFPAHNIVEVLPVENVSQLSFKIPSFYSADIREVGAFIASTDVFIGADSGIMHLASAVHTPTVGLFSITDAHAFGPYGHDSVAIDTNNTTIDELMYAIGHILCEGDASVSYIPLAKRRRPCENANQ